IFLRLLLLLPPPRAPPIRSVKRGAALARGERWPVPSRPLVSPQEERLPGSSLQPRLLVSLLPPLEELRSPIHAKRVTIMPKDIQLARRIRGERA
ncbi:hypothetical protein EE612_017819, partial [Oryza sativa]